MKTNGSCIIGVGGVGGDDLQRTGPEEMVRQHGEAVVGDSGRPRRDEFRTTGFGSCSQGRKYTVHTYTHTYMIYVCICVHACTQTKTNTTASRLADLSDFDFLDEPASELVQDNFFSY